MSDQIYEVKEVEECPHGIHPPKDCYMCSVVKDVEEKENKPEDDESK